jgi:hypothetical protein
MTAAHPWITLVKRADRYLSYLESEWAAVPRVASEWAQWSEDERLDLQIEWGMREDRLAALERMEVEGTLGAAHAAQLAALQRLIAANRDTLERLFVSCVPAASAET